MEKRVIIAFVLSFAVLYAFRAWFSPEATALRTSVHNKECWCTNEVFMWPSINYQPIQLAKALIGSRPWEKPVALRDEERHKVLPEISEESDPVLKII